MLAINIKDWLSHQLVVKERKQPHMPHIRVSVISLKVLKSH